MYWSRLRYLAGLDLHSLLLACNWRWQLHGLAAGPILVSPVLQMRGMNAHVHQPVPIKHNCCTLPHSTRVPLLAASIPLQQFAMTLRSEPRCTQLHMTTSKASNFCLSINKLKSMIRANFRVDLLHPTTTEVHPTCCKMCNNPKKEMNRSLNVCHQQSHQQIKVMQAYSMCHHARVIDSVTSMVAHCAYMHAV